MVFSLVILVNIGDYFCLQTVMSIKIDCEGILSVYLIMFLTYPLEEIQVLGWDSSKFIGIST